MTPVIEVRDVAKGFWVPRVRRDTVREHVLGLLRPNRYEQLQVLDGVSFDLQRGEALGIMGRNGCGKSTLLKIVSSVYPPDRGVVRVRAPLTPVLELGVGWNPELERFANLKLKHYSSGMSSRLGYAVAFEAVRDVLILDEVFAVGDAGFRVRCEQRYEELLAQGHTVLMVGHDPKVIGSFCDRALLLDTGRIVLEGPATTVADRYMSLLMETPPDAMDLAASAFPRSALASGG